MVKKILFCVVLKEMFENPEKTLEKDHREKNKSRETNEPKPKKIRNC